jgi:hypothetical protein
VWVSQCVKTNGVWSAWSAPTPYIVPGEDGAAGKAGPAMVFRGRAVWNQNEGTSMTFYNNASRRDVVVSDWGGGSIVYYIYKGTDGKTLTSHTVNNVNTSWDAAEWESFGASFSSIATGLLLAENANIAHWIFQDQKLVSEDGGAFLDGRTGEVSIKGKFRSSSGGFTSEISDGDLKVYSGDTETTAGRRILLEANSSSGYKWGALEISDTSGYSALLRGNCLVLKKGNVEKLNINTNIYEDADMMQIILNRATIVVQNNLNIQGLPTNSQGLKNGDVYKSEGYLRIYSN